MGKSGTIFHTGQTSIEWNRDSTALSLRGQTSMELAIIAAIMLLLLLSIGLINSNLSFTWEEQRQKMEASSAASQVALAINRAAAGGNGTQVGFFNRVSDGVENMSVYDRRSVRAYYKLGGFSSVSIVTNNTDIGEIPINRDIVAVNTGGKITIEEG